MNLMTIAANILDVPADRLSDASTGQNTPNWDSARHIDLLLTVEVAFGVQFSMAEITRMYSLGDMRAMLEAKGAGSVAA